MIYPNYLSCFKVVPEPWQRNSFSKRLFVPQNTALYLVWYIYDKNHTKGARIIKGWFKYMTDCKNFPDHLIYSSRKMAASRSLSPRIPGVTLIL